MRQNNTKWIQSHIIVFNNIVSQGMPVSAAFASDSVFVKTKRKYTERKRALNQTGFSDGISL